MSSSPDTKLIEKVARARESLSDCPICGGEPDLHDYGDGWFRVICPCTVQGPLRQTEMEACRAWNIRPAQAALTAIQSEGSGE